MKIAKTTADKHKREQQIIGTAATMLNKQPVSAFTMSDLATNAGLSKGTTFNYFSTKEDLFLAVLAAEFDTYVTVLAANDDAQTDLPTLIDFATAQLFAQKFRSILRLVAIKSTLVTPNRPAVQQFSAHASTSTARAARQLTHFFPLISSAKVNEITDGIIALTIGNFTLMPDETDTSIARAKVRTQRTINFYLRGMLH